MFMQTNSTPEKPEDSFSCPVESLTVRCEDFKSNFARKLSNRYKSRTVLTPRLDSSLNLCPPKNVHDIRIQSSQISKSIMKQNVEAVKLPDKSLKSTGIRATEFNALNIEIEMLRWQLSQTEANRQLHIALLKQIVTFLNRVKDHIECQIPKGFNESNVAEGALSLADLPRSRSVLNLNKSLEYSPNKKIYTRKTKIKDNNLNSFKDYNVGSQSKIVLTSETEVNQKLSEEMTRLITLANNVLSTKIPDLANTRNHIDVNATNIVNNSTNNEETENKEPNALSNVTEKNSNPFRLYTIGENENEQAFDVIKIDTKDTSVSGYKVLPLSLICGLEDEFNEVKIIEKDNTKEKPIDKTNDYNYTANFVEDESGFSSMSSFQEIGIPIISIIPPSPCKDIDYIDEIPIILDETEKREDDAILTELDKQRVKVFWV